MKTQTYASFNFVNNYKPSLDKNTNSIFSIFSKYNIDLNFEKYISSDLLMLRKLLMILSSRYLIQWCWGNKRPKDLNNLNNEIKLSLKHEDYNLDTGLKSYENLQARSSDRYNMFFHIIILTNY